MDLQDSSENCTQQSTERKTIPIKECAMIRKLPEIPTTDYLTVTNNADNYNEIELKDPPSSLEAGIKCSETKSKFQYDYAYSLQSQNQINNASYNYIEFNSDGTTTDIPVQVSSDI
jgi:hypothetical protein